MSAPRLSDLAWVGLGAACGALLRWSLTLGDSSVGTHPLLAVLAINVVGSFCLGVLPALPAARGDHRVTLFLGPGLLGGFTTVSTWAGQSLELMAEGRSQTAAAYVVGTLSAALVAAAAGRRLSQRPQPMDALT